MSDETNFDAPATIWLWLFPVTYVAHIAEEFWGGGGYPAFMLRTRGITITPTRFLVMSGVAWGLMLVGVMLARRLRFQDWLLVCLGTLVLANGLSHTINTLLRGEYNPGLVSGVLVWIPLGVVTLFRLKGSMQGSRYMAAIAVGSGIQVVISLLAMKGGSA